jgi:hypothetical protein
MLRRATALTKRKGEAMGTIRFRGRLEAASQRQRRLRARVAPPAQGQRDAFDAKNVTSPVFILVFSAMALGLNWLWEMIQMPAFANMRGLSWAETAGRCLLAAAGDVLALWLMLLGATLLNGLARHRSLGRPFVFYGGATAIGLAVAGVIERVALPLGRWSYASGMPLIPFVGVGLWPFLQLAVLFPLAHGTAAWAMRGLAPE